MRLHWGTAHGGAWKLCWAAFTIAGMIVTASETVSAAGAAPPSGAEPQLAPLPPIPMPMPSKSSASETPKTALPSIPEVPPTTSAPAPAAAPAPAPVVEPVAMPNTRVYVLGGVDPFGWAGMDRLVDRLRGSGYPDARFGGWYQARQFEREIRQLQTQQPGTPVAIIGYSFGVYRARAVANRLTRDGIPVAMVGYVGGDYLRNTASVMPGGARVVNVTGNGFLLTGRNLFFNGTDLSGANNLRLGVRHFELPKQEQTYDALMAGLNGSGGSGTYVPPAQAVASSAPPTNVAVYPTSPAPTSATTAGYYPSPAYPAAVSTSPAAMTASMMKTQQGQSNSRPLFRLVGRNR